MRRASVLAVMLLFAFNAYAFHAFDATQFRTAHPTIGPRLAVASKWSEVYDPASTWATSAARCFN